MTDTFLKAKHWQLFLLIFGIPIVFQFVMMGIILANIRNPTDPVPSFMLNYFRFLPLMMIVFLGVFFGWFWAVAIGLQRKVPPNVTMKIRKFKIFFFIPIIYLLFFTIFIGGLINGLVESGTNADAAVIGSLLWIIIPIHLFSMVCIFYSFYFVAKTIKTVELQREVSFQDFAGEFFLIWFYPIGIWIIQPKINKMVEG